MKVSQSTPPAPAAPSPIDPGQASIDYINAMADPELQSRLLAAEQQFRPEYTALNLQELSQYMNGVGGQPGALGLLGQATQQTAAIESQALRAQREADIASVEQLGGRASAAFRNANPQLQAAINQAQGLMNVGSDRPIQDFNAYVRNNPDLLANYQNNTSQNTSLSMEDYGRQHYEQAGRTEGRALPTSQTGGFYSDLSTAINQGAPGGQIQFNPAQAALLGQAPQAGAQGYNAALAGPAQQLSAASYQGSMLGAAPMVQGQGYGAAMAGPVANIGADQVGGGLLGGQLMQQAMAAGGLGQVGGLLQGRASDLAQSQGRLSPDELRSLQQGVREAYAARGVDMGSGAISAEALSRLTNERARMQEDLSLAASINQGNQAELGANRAFQQNVQGADLSRQFGNQSANLQASMSNQGVAAQQSALNQAAQNQASQYGATAANNAAFANQGMLAQYGLANQQSANQAGQFNASSANQIGMANQQAQLAQSFANQQALNQAGQFGANAYNTASLANAGILSNYGLSNQAAANQYGLANMQAGLGVQESNRDFANSQYQQNIGNLGFLGQLRQNQLGTDRSFALQLAGLTQATQSDPFQAILGRPSQAMGAAQQQQGFGAGLLSSLQGPQLFDPNAGINLALQNNSNQANYNAGIFGSQAALAGANAQAQGSMMGGLISAGGSIAGAGLIAF